MDDDMESRKTRSNANEHNSFRQLSERFVDDLEATGGELLSFSGESTYLSVPGLGGGYRPAFDHHELIEADDDEETRWGRT